jgi:hypothetical protein
MDIERMGYLYALLVKAAVYSDSRDLPEWRFDGTEIKTAQDVASAMGIPLIEAKERLLRNEIPGWEGSIGPFPHQYGSSHVYARDIHSGAGNCVCGRHPESSIHVIASKDVYAGSGSGSLTRGIGTRTQHRGICQRANALAYGYRRRRRHKRENKK